MMPLVFLILTMVALMILAFLLSGNDLLSPSVVMCGMLAVSGSFAAMMTEEWTGVNFSYDAIMILIGGVVAFMAGEFCVRVLLAVIPKRRRRVKLAEPIVEPRPLRVDPRKLRWVSVGAVVVIFFQYYEIIRLAGVGGYQGIGNLLSFYRVQSTYTLSEESMNGIVLMGMRILQVVAYLASFAFVNNVFALKEGWRKNVGYLVPVVLFCVSMLLGTSRGRVLWMLVFWMVVSFYLTWRASGWKERQSARYFRRGLTVAAIGLPLFYYSANLVGRVSQLTHGMKEYLGIYFGGSIAHFNQYIESPPPPDSHFGEEIFLNIYTFLHGLGLSDYQRLIHLEFRYVNANTRGNIYTFFRRPLQDFGLSGMLLVAFIVAAIFTYVLCRHIKGQQPSPKGDLVILLYGYFFFLIAGSSLENMLFEYLAVSKIMIVVLLIFCYRLFFNDQEPLFARKRSRRLRRRALAGKGLSHAAS